jgi:hypothetical protein
VMRKVVPNMEPVMKNHKHYVSSLTTGDKDLENRDLGIYTKKRYMLKNRGRRIPIARVVLSMLNADENRNNGH